MVSGKWISELTADMPLADAARRVLMVRLDVVQDYLPRAIHDAATDPEYVHHLRVGTRRARAALDIFRACLPKKASKKARKQLKGIRRAAGEARDWDVFLLALAEKQRTAATHRPGLDFLFGFGFAQRALAQTHLVQIGTIYPRLLKRLQANTVEAVRSPSKTQAATLGDLARPMLSDLLAELDAAAGQDLEDYGHLHEVRIVGKRLRYAMEIFADCFAPPFREQMYPAIVDMQEILGNANDSHVACQRLAALREELKNAWPLEWKRFRLGIEGLLRYHQRRLPQERQRFLAWWQRWRSSGAEQALETLIKRNE